MGYMIELSFDIIKTNNFICLKNNIIDLANKYDKVFLYNNHEIMGKNRTIFRNHYVITILFEDDDKKVSKFIREIKQNYKKVNIESISYDNCILKLTPNKLSCLSCISFNCLNNSVFSSKKS